MNYIPVSIEIQVNVDASTQDYYVAGSSGKDKEPTQEYILLPLHPHGLRISIEDVVHAAQENPSENAPKDKDRMVAQEMVAKAMDDATRQAFKEENTANTPYASAASTPTGANADGSSFVYLGGQIPIDTSTLPNADLSIDPNMNELEYDSDVFLNGGIFSKAFDDEDVGAEADFNNMDNTIDVSPIPTLRIHKDHLKDQILGDPTLNRTNHKDHQNYLFACFLSQEEPKKISQALEDDSWIEAMQEELLQFKLQKVWILVDLPSGKKAIGTKWVFRNKRDERGIVVKNKERLVAQGHRQEEGIDYDEVFSPIARIDAIRLFLAFASFIGFPVYQMDVKSSFLYGIIGEEVYVHQPLGFVDPAYPNKVYKVVKALYGLHQASRAWYETLYTFLLENGYKKGTINKTFFIKKNKSNIIFQMSSIAELTFFLGLHVKQQADGIFISQDKFMIGSLMYLTTSRPDIMFAVYSPFKLEAFSNNDYGGASLDKKSTTGGCQFLGRRLISWQCKKQTIVANSTTKAKYVAVASCFKNPVYHSRTKHNEIQHHFIRDCYEKILIDALKIHTDNNVADLLTKGFDVIRFNFLVAVVVTEASIRSSLLFNDADGTACLTNEAIFQNLALMGYEGELNKLTFQKALFSPQWKYLIHTIIHCLSLKSTSWNEFSTNIASAIICLATNQKFNFFKLVFDGMLRNLDTSKKKFLMYPRFLMVLLNNQIKLDEPFNDVYATPAYTQKVFTNMTRKGLKFLGKITPLFPSMLTQAVVNEGEGSEQPTEPQPTPSPSQPSTADQPPITALSSGPEHSYRPSLNLEETGKIEGDQRKKSKLESTLDDSTVFDDLNVDHGMDYMEIEEAVGEGRKSDETEEVKLTDDTEEVIKDKGIGKKGGSSEELVSIAVPEIVSTARPDVDAARQQDSTVEPKIPLTTSILDDEDITIAQTLIKIKEVKAKEKGVSIKDVKDASRPKRLVLTLNPLPTIDPKDKGKGVLKDSPIKKVKKGDLDAAQIAKDAEIAKLIYEEELAELEREKEKRQKEEETSKTVVAEMFNEVQARIDVDALFAAKLQQEEREECTIKERAKFLAETIVAQRKFRAKQRSAEIRSRPPTKSQLRNLMMTYLRNMGGYKHYQLKLKTFEEIQGLYERHKRIIDNFKPMDLNDAVRDTKEAPGVHKEKVFEEHDSTKVEVKQEGHTKSTRKRSGIRLKMKATKRSKMQKTDSDLKEEKQLKAFLKIVLDEEGEVDYEVLDKRYPIVDWESKFYHTDRYGKPHDYYKVIRSDGSSRWIKTFSKMVTRFDRMGLKELYNLVMQRFATTTPEGIDLIL
ncbi:putative ribonuclease H-like domain-containing protein [Tanacetum coccineum]|uniref:Ribonuclease H-like domain-containing protein n=1 Tax=Tanacetum coccineum TaxID=301880 RepID=A0ABQ5FBG3_9ASTR